MLVGSLVADAIWDSRHVRKEDGECVAGEVGHSRKGSTSNRGLAKKDRMGMYMLVPETELAESAAKRRRQLQEGEYLKSTRGVV